MCFGLKVAASVRKSTLFPSQLQTHAHPALTILCMVQQQWPGMGALTPAVLSRLAKELKELTRQPCEGIRVGVKLLLLQHRLHLAASRPAAVWQQWIGWRRQTGP